MNFGPVCVVYTYIFSDMIGLFRQPQPQNERMLQMHDQPNKYLSFSVSDIGCIGCVTLHCVCVTLLSVLPCCLVPVVVYSIHTFGVFFLPLYISFSKYSQIDFVWKRNKKKKETLCVSI